MTAIYRGITPGQARWMYVNRLQNNANFDFVRFATCAEDLYQKYHIWQTEYKESILARLRAMEKFVNMNDEEIFETLINDTPSVDRCLTDFQNNKTVLQNSIRVIANSYGDGEEVIDKVPISDFYKEHFDPDLAPLLQKVAEFCTDGTCSSCKYMRPLSNRLYRFDLKGDVARQTTQ